MLKVEPLFLILSKGFVEDEIYSHGPSQVSEIIAMAWADEIPFHAIEKQLGVSRVRLSALCVRI